LNDYSFTSAPQLERDPLDRTGKQNYKFFVTAWAGYKSRTGAASIRRTASPCLTWPGSSH